MRLCLCVGVYQLTKLNSVYTVYKLTSSFLVVFPYKCSRVYNIKLYCIIKNKMTSSQF